MAPPSIPPPPPPPPPLNIPPSRARLQLAARLAMHQKNNQSAQASSATLHNDGDDDDGLDPFADADDDVDVDDDDGSHDDGRGAWWRGVIRKDDGDSDDDDDDEFGDFAMAEDVKGGGSTDDNVVLKPLAVNPAKENTRTLSGLWPFGTKKERGPPENSGEADTAGGKNDGMVPALRTGEEREREDHPVEVKEAKSRTSIEDPDDDDEYGAELLAGTRS
jgi:SIT4-associating protein SAP185/190